MSAELTLVKSEKFGSITCDVYKGNGDFWMTREQIGAALGYEFPKQAIGKIHERHKDRLDQFSAVVSLTTPSGSQKTTIYSPKGIYEICRWSRQPKADAFYDWVYDVLESLRTGQAAVVPTAELSPELQMFSKLFESIAKQELRQKRLEQELQIAKHRLDNLDAVNLKGDKQQRLNAMIRKYAHQNGLAFSRAWNDFVQAFNTAYRTNLQLLKHNYHKQVTTPEFLAETDRLDDALRIADKMLNLGEGA